MSWTPGLCELLKIARGGYTACGGIPDAYPKNYDSVQLLVVIPLQEDLGILLLFLGRSLSATLVTLIRIHFEHQTGR